MSNRARPVPLAPERILAERLPPEVIEQTRTVSFQYPDGAWQMFKHRHRRAWWFWLPVRATRLRTSTKTVTFRLTLSRFRTYPEAQLGEPVLSYFLTEDFVEKSDL